MINKLRNILNRKYGIIINVDNTTISFDGDKLKIEIPIESFDKYSSEIINGDEVVKFVKGRKGFKSYKI